MRTVFEVNGAAVELDLEPRVMLVEALRYHLCITGTRVGCDTTSCGACTVLLNDMPVKSCTMLAVQAHGAEVVTIEGLTPGDGLSDVQRAFVLEHGLQCGFCTPGLIVSVTALLDRVSAPTDAEVRSAIEGNLCRCTGYVNIMRAARLAAALRRGEHPQPEAGRSHEVPLAPAEDVAPDAGNANL